MACVRTFIFAPLFIGLPVQELRFPSGTRATVVKVWCECVCMCVWDEWFCVFDESMKCVCVGENELPLPSLCPLARSVCTVCSGGAANPFVELKTIVCKVMFSNLYAQLTFAILSGLSHESNVKCQQQFITACHGVKVMTLTVMTLDSEKKMQAT